MTTKIFKYAVIVLLLAGSFSSCKEKEKCEPFVLIGQRSLSGGEGIPQQAIVIKTQEEWEDFKTVMNTEYYQGQNTIKETDSFSETEIDFDQYQIIAVIDEVRPDMGWSMEIKCMKEHIDKIAVIVQVSTLEKGFSAPLTEHQPYHIVKIHVTKKSIEFKHIKK